MAVDEVKIKNQVRKDNTFAMYVKKEDKYEPYTGSDMFPDSNLYTLNLDESGCMDSNGKKIEGILSNDNNKVTVTSSQTVYCYLYFDEKTLLGGNYVANKKSKGLQETNTGSLQYRYVGTEVDNYICIDPNVGEGTCNENYLYRIIGTTSEGNLKLIKATAYNTSTMWNSSYYLDYQWSQGDLGTELNSESFLNNASYIPQTLKTKIINMSWNQGSVSTETNTGQEVYDAENTTQDNTSTQIGLMYLSDYYYAENNAGTTNCQSTSSCNNWLKDSSNNQWTITRFRGDDGYGAWLIISSGSLDHWDTNNSNAAYPVFYLSADIKVSGEGTTSNPFKIAL